jgi:hypothetical protein
VVSLSLSVFAGVALIWMAVTSRRHIREMAHRERLAMIERGLIPPPEVDPAAFERKTGLARPRSTHTSARMRSAGVIIVGLGLALLVLLSFAAGVPGVGFGIGGAFVVLGLAFYFNSFVRDSVDEGPTRAANGYPPLQRVDPHPDPQSDDRR